MFRLHPCIPGAIKVTAAELVRELFGARPLGQAAVQDAIALMRQSGWFANHTPEKFLWRRTVIFVPRNHRMEPIFRCLDGQTATASVPRGLVESRTRCRLNEPRAGVWLGVFGLAIVAVENCNVVIRGTSGGMACGVNSARYGEAKPVRCERLIERATGLTLPAEHINYDLRLRTAMAFGSFAVDVPGLLAGAAQSPMVSRWQFPPSPASLKNLDPPF